MTDPKTNPLAAVGTMTGLAEEMVDVAMAGQMAGLHVLLDEMQALATVLPGLAVPQPLSEGEERAIAAAVEESFDNMPV